MKKSCYTPLSPQTAAETHESTTPPHFFLGTTLAAGSYINPRGTKHAEANRGGKCSCTKYKQNTGCSPRRKMFPKNQTIPTYNGKPWVHQRRGGGGGGYFLQSPDLPSLLSPPETTNLSLKIFLVRATPATNCPQRAINENLARPEVPRCRIPSVNTHRGN